MGAFASKGNIFYDVLIASVNALIELVVLFQGMFARKVANYETHFGKDINQLMHSGSAIFADATCLISRSVG